MTSGFWEGYSSEWIVRAQGLKRWHSVPMTVQQTLAEHMWNVAMLSQRITKPEYRHIFSARDIFQWALVHDLDEIVSGDMNGKWKRLLDEDERADLQKHVIKFMPAWWLEQRTCLGEDEHLVVKICDIADNYRMSKYIVTAHIRSQAMLDHSTALGEMCRYDCALFHELLIGNFYEYLREYAEKG